MLTEVRSSLCGLEQMPYLGQVWTPPEIAEWMVAMALAALGKQPAFALDPACGPATFERAMACAGLKPRKLLALDIDPRMSEFTSDMINRLGLRGESLCSDYLETRDLQGKADMIIMNPPYIRQELITNRAKSSFAEFASAELGTRIDRRANLLAYFLIKAAVDLRPGGVLCAIVYDSVAHTAYGKRTMAELLRFMEPLSSETVAAPFKNVLIDAKILLMRRRKRIVAASELPAKVTPLPDGAARLDDLLSSRRGSGLPDRKTFLAKPNDPFFEQSTPFFVKQARLSGVVVDEADERAYLLENESDNPKLVRWLRARLKDVGKPDASIHRRPVSGPILFNYYIRSSPRHLINPDYIPAADNFYISEPVNGFPVEAAWLLLNSMGFIEPILAAGRSQGNGLLKLQLFEYKNAAVPDWRLLNAVAIKEIQREAKSLIRRRASLEEIKHSANATFDAHFRK